MFRFARAHLEGETSSFAARTNRGLNSTTECDGCFCCHLQAVGVAVVAAAVAEVVAEVVEEAAAVAEVDAVEGVVAVAAGASRRKGAPTYGGARRWPAGGPHALGAGRVVSVDTVYNRTAHALVSSPRRTLLAHLSWLRRMLVMMSRCSLLPMICSVVERGGGGRT